MSVESIHQDVYLFNGTGALKPEVFPLRPKLRFVSPQAETEFIPSAKIISLSDFRERKNRQAIIQNAAPVASPVLPEASKLESQKTKPESRPELITGFSVVDEARSVTQIYDEGKARGLSHEQSFEEAWRDHEGNLVRYHFEYTMRFPVLVNPVVLNEHGHLVNSDSGRRLVDMTSAEERNGAVCQSVIKTEQLLKDAKEGEVVIAPSPRGGTGKFKNGKEIEYGETEVFFYQKLNEREIRAFTFIADLSYEQVLEVCKFFITPDVKISNLNLPERERIENMVSNPFLISAGATSAHEFLNTVQDVQGGNIMRKANGADRTFNQGHELIDLEDDLKLLPQRVKASRDVYKQFLKKAIIRGGDIDTMEMIEQKMGISLLEDIKIIEGKVEKDSPQVSVGFREAINSTSRIDSSFFQQNYGEQLHFIKTKMVGLGCNVTSSSGSESIFGQSMSETLSGFSSGGGRIGEASSGLVPKCINCKLELCEGRCPNCEKKASRAA